MLSNIVRLAQLDSFHSNNSIYFQPDSLDEPVHDGFVSRERRDTSDEEYEEGDYYAEVDEDKPLYTVQR